MTYSILLWNINWHHMIAFSDHVTTSSEVCGFAVVRTRRLHLALDIMAPLNFGFIYLSCAPLASLSYMVCYDVWFWKKKKTWERERKVKQNEIILKRMFNFILYFSIKCDNELGRAYLMISKVKYPQKDQPDR